MSWIDLLRMSTSNLKRRKLRTFLTVLGVVIGTASIVVMVSLGLGLQKSVYDEMEQSGGLTTINVTGSGSAGGGMMHSSNSDKSDKSDKSDEASKYIDDNCVKKFGELEHVRMLITTGRVPVGFRAMQELTEMEHPMFRSQPRNIL